jgi:hypothetical protein
MISQKSEKAVFIAINAFLTRDMKSQEKNRNKMGGFPI